MKKLFTFLFVVAMFASYASDSLKVKKVTFFVEPKAIVFIPKQSHLTTNINDVFDDGSYAENMNVHNKATINFGFSTGASFGLGKYFKYNLSLDYYYYNIQTKKTGTYETGWMSFINFNGTQNYSSQLHFLGIGNGISFTYKKFIVTNTLIAYATIFAKNKTVSHNTIDNTTSSNTSTSKFNFSEKPSLMSEHKIGHSFLNGKLETYVGVLIQYAKYEASGYYSFPLYYRSSNPYTNVTPFTSIRLNF